MTSLAQFGDAAAGKERTRATLQAAVDSYLAAQKAGDLSKALLAGRVG